MFTPIFNPLKLILRAMHLGGWVRGALCLGCLGLIVTSCGCGKDRAQWSVAAAVNEADNGNPEGAIELLQEALRLDPDSDSIKLRLAVLLAENDQGDLSEMLCGEVLENRPGDKKAWLVLSDCLHFMGRFDEALTAYQNCVADKIDKDTFTLNQLSYFRGLAGVELDKALRQVNEGVRKYERRLKSATVRTWGAFAFVPIEINAIVSAGLLSRYSDEGHLYVMDLLNDRIQKEQENWLRVNARLDRLYERQESQGEFVTGRKAKELQELVKQTSDLLERVAANLPVLLATRSLIFEDQGKPQLADLDRLWLKRIGKQPQEVYDSLPDDFECMAALLYVQSILDTRGYVLTLLPWQPTWAHPSGIVMQLEDKASRIPYVREGEGSYVSYGSYERALEDLNLAVAAAEICLLTLNSDAANRIEYPVEIIRSKKVEVTKSIAILRNHRRQAHLKANQIEAAELDWKRIEGLGFGEEDSLF